MADTPLTALRSRRRTFPPRRDRPGYCASCARTSSQMQTIGAARFLGALIIGPPHVLSKGTLQPRRPSATGSGRRDSPHRRHLPRPPVGSDCSARPEPELLDALTASRACRAVVRVGRIEREVVAAGDGADLLIVLPVMVTVADSARKAPARTPGSSSTVPRAPCCESGPTTGGPDPTRRLDRITSCGDCAGCPTRYV
jgi:hypothetical protein